MIGNQILPSSAEKSSSFTGKNGAEGKLTDEKPKGGLFQLMMNSVSGDAASAEDGKSSSGDGRTILGGNLTLHTADTGEEKDEADGSALLRIFAGGEGLIEKKSEDSQEENESDTQSVTPAEGETISDTSETKPESQESDEEPITAEGNDENEESEAGEAAGTEDSAEEENKGNETAGQTKSSESSETANHNSSGTTEGNSMVDESGEQENAGKSSAQNPDTELKENESDAKTKGESNPTDSKSDGDKKELQVNGPDHIKQAGGGGDAQTVKGESRSVQNGEVITDEKQIRSGDRPMQKEAVKDRGLINELRALAAARGEQVLAGEGPMESSPEWEGGEIPDDAKLLEEMFQALQNGSTEQVAAEIRSLRASQVRENRYNNYLASFSNRNEVAGGQGFSLASNEAGTGSSAGPKSLNSIPVMELVPMGGADMADTFDTDAAALWKEHLTEYFESNEKSSADNQAAAAFARLGDVPVTNISVRRGFAQGISQGILTTTGNGKADGETWQRHNFVMDDGKNIQVSARQVEGVLQLKLSSSYTELNKLLMEHQDDIRDLLENEVELKIDLQFDGGGGDALTDFFGGSSKQNSKDGDSLFEKGNLKTTDQEIEEVVPKAVRKFGYNQMEWTV